MAWKTTCDLSSEDAQYNYCANGPAALLFTVLFGLTFLAHLAQLFLHHKRFCWVIVMGTGWECVGMIMRTYSTLDQTKETTASAGQLLVLLAPLWVNAFVYMIFGRMVHYYLADQKVGGVRAESLAKIFIWLDITAFIIQATGGIMDSDFSVEMNKIGLHIYTAGIALQQFFILCFWGLLITFHRRMLQGWGNYDRNLKWKQLVIAMYATLAFLTIRIVYRLVEFADVDNAGNSPLSTKEAFFYCLECLTMFAAMVIWNIWHPGRLMPGVESEFPKKVKISRKERKRMEREDEDMEARKADRDSEIYMMRSGDEADSEVRGADSGARR